MSESPIRRLAIATSVIVPGIHPDDAHLAVSLQRLGIEPTACVWNDPDVNWSHFDAVLMRSTWDYFKHYPAFRQWLDQLPVPTINNKALLRWNSDKRYLLELAAQGIEIIPTQIVPASQLQQTLASMPVQQVVVKPTVSGTARHTARGRSDDVAFNQIVAQLPLEFDYLIQPYVPEVVSDGEWSLLFFDGEFSHAVIKRPAAGDYRVQSEFGGTAQAIEPDEALIATAKRALAAAAAIGHADIAYARVDGVISQDRFLLMELEMIEPFLHFEGRHEAAERFAANLRKRLAA
ncbi:ATP-grasp domain-containing protein [Dyella sp. Tek66A03]|uniref:ATP-grasp domain-containing protein n=1 Tax=Dyella sp. Tek66A03 TaxID=3458298 RepID=UPI00403E7FC2